MNATIRKCGNDFEVIKEVINSKTAKSLPEQFKEIKENASKFTA